MRPDRSAAPAGPLPFRLGIIGGFDLAVRSGEPIGLPTRKAQLLLAYLALPAGSPHPREKLAALFWGDRGEEQARGSLRNALSALRAALGPEAIAVDRDAIELRPGFVDLDVDRLTARGDGGPPVDLIDLALRTELLAGAQSRSEEFAEWLAFERDRCRGLAQAAARAAIATLAAAGSLAAAIDLARRLVAVDPLREQSHRLLMELLLSAGERTDAMAQFRRCRQLLKDDLGVEPSAETRAVAARIARADAAEVLMETPPEPWFGPEPSAASVSEQAARPSERFFVAVLPFVDKSGTSEPSFIAEGFSEDLITEMSRRSDFSVIAPQSSAIFSGRADSAAAAANELSARYALAGSLRRAGDALRVTVQLIDAVGNRCIWAERYDRTIADIFAVQDEIVSSIVGSVDAEVRKEERERAARKLPNQLDAWELFHRGLWHVYRFAPEDVSIAETLFEDARRRAPDFSLPHAGLAYACFVKAVWFFVPDPRPVVAEGLAHAQTALRLDDQNAFGHVVFGRLLTIAGEVGRGMHHLRLALGLNPSFAQAHFGLAQALVYAGRPKEALDSIAIAMRLSPKDPLTSMFLTLRSFCHFSLGEDAEAERAARSGARFQSRELWSRLALAVALVGLGRIDEARAVIAEARLIQPVLPLESFARLVASAPPAVRQRVWTNLRLAGIETLPAV